MWLQSTLTKCWYHLNQLLSTRRSSGLWKSLGCSTPSLAKGKGRNAEWSTKFTALLISIFSTTETYSICTAAQLNLWFHSPNTNEQVPKTPPAAPEVIFLWHGVGNPHFNCFFPAASHPRIYLKNWIQNAKYFDTKKAWWPNQGIVKMVLVTCFY